MKETLIIRNFGPIKDMTFDFRKVNIFIGDQGTGKSSVAKLFSLIKNFISIRYLYKENSELANDNNWQFEQHLNNFGIKEYINEETEFEYINSGLNLEIKYNKFTVTATSIDYPSIFNFPLFTYIVAERVFVSSLADALYGIIQTGAKLPPLFNRFGSNYSTSRKEKSLFYYNELIGVNFLHNGADFIVLKNEKLIPLSDGSTGMQGTIPMLVVFDSVVSKISPNGRLGIHENNVMVIEEPELNLFPETQKKILDYIIGNNFEIPVINTYDDNDEFMYTINPDFDNKKFKNQLIITTHSPYILTSLNNLISAYNAGNEHGDEVEKIIERKYWLNPEDASAYMIMPDGTCEDIFDREENLIHAEKIDSVSTILNQQFDEILTIDFAGK